MKTVDFYFDVISPYSWLAERELASLGATIVYRPILFAAVLAAHGTKGPAEIEAKREFTFRDVMRTAQLKDFTYEGPPSHPYNPLKALRFLTAVPAADRARASHRVLRACWEDGEDLTDDATIARLADDLGLSDALARVGDQAVKDALKQETDGAIKKGVFGVPSFVVGEELFWGSDRITHLKAFLDGRLTLDEVRLAAALARPQAHR